METTETLPSAKLGNVAGYGLFNYATMEGAFVFRGHNGGMAGGLTEMAYLSDYGRGYAVMINSGKGKAPRQIGNLVRRYVIRDLTSPAGRQVGSPAVSKFIRKNQPLLGCSGHIHESPYQPGGRWMNTNRKDDLVPAWSDWIISSMLSAWKSQRAS